MNNIGCTLNLLPLPDIREENLFEYSFKQNRRHEESNRFRPSKFKRHENLCSKQNSQLNNTSLQIISFRSGSANNSNTDEEGFVKSAQPGFANLSSMYDPDANTTYFEQCFETVSKLGEGSFGEVFKVRCKDDGLNYAIKMSKNLFRGESYRQERLEEVKRYEQFSGNENCVRFYCAWEENDRLYMQMELCRENLEDYLQKRRFIPESKIWSILLDLLLALKSLHDKNLIHLDIKLDNILIGDDDTCKLADFGLVVDIAKANRNQATEGDSRYMAPEIMHGHFSKAADIFSLGIAMLELSCFLELPANGPLWQKLRNGVIPENFIQNVSVQLQEVIKMMMSPNPESRPTVEQILHHKKLTSLIAKRRFYAPIKMLCHKYRATKHIIWSTICKLKNLSWKIVNKIHKSFSGTKTNLENNFETTKNNSANLFSSTPNFRCRINSLEEISDSSSISNEFNEGESRESILYNSTPIAFKNSHHRIRKDLSKDMESAPDHCCTEAFISSRATPQTEHLVRKRLFDGFDI